MSDLLEKIASAFKLYQFRAAQYLIEEPQYVFCADKNLIFLAKSAVADISGGLIDSNALFERLIPDMKSRDGTGMFLTELLTKLDQKILRVPARANGQGVPFLKSLGYSLRSDQSIIVGEGVHVGDFGGNDCKGLLVEYGDGITMGRAAAGGTYVNDGEVTLLSFNASAGTFVNCKTCQIQGLYSVGCTQINLGETYSLKPENGSRVINYGKTFLGSGVIRSTPTEEHRAIIATLRKAIDELKMCSSDEQAIHLIDRVTCAIAELASKK